MNVKKIHEESRPCVNSKRPNQTICVGLMFAEMNDVITGRHHKNDTGNVSLRRRCINSVFYAA
jgi:hypothetical protein